MPINPGFPTNFPSPLKAVPSNSQVVPVEGRMQIPVEILWTSMGGAGKVVGFDAQENNVQSFGPVAGLVIDNSECAVAITIVFPDTGEKIVIPASAKRVAICVYTNGTAFTVSAVTAGATDITRMQVLNYRIPQIYIA